MPKFYDYTKQGVLERRNRETRSAEKRGKLKTHDFTREGREEKFFIFRDASDHWTDPLVRRHLQKMHAHNMRLRQLDNDRLAGIKRKPRKKLKPVAEVWKPDAIVAEGEVIPRHHVEPKVKRILKAIEAGRCTSWDDLARALGWKLQPVLYTVVELHVVHGRIEMSNMSIMNLFIENEWRNAKCSSAEEYAEYHSQKAAEAEQRAAWAARQAVWEAAIEKRRTSGPLDENCATGGPIGPQWPLPG
jgi:hypothetical protein